MEQKSEKVLEISFDLNTINHLGVKLYSTIPPMIAELVSNAWDADAHNVHITFTEIGNKSIIVKDDGLGMTFEELNDQFLKVGRNRRIETKLDETPSGRKVLGKKGLGKLSMFGIGKKITVSTVKNSLRNTFVMDYDEIENNNDHQYHPVILELDVSTTDSSGTSIKIENLSRKLPVDVDNIRTGLISRFSIFSKDFTVHINGDDKYKIDKNDYKDEHYQFIWNFPEDFKVLLNKENELMHFAISKGITGTVRTSHTPLHTVKRGIVLFSRGKLVQEHNSFHPRGNDNYFQYMSGAFDVDFIDNDKRIDNCSTDRKSLAWDNFENEDLDTLKLLLEKIVVSTGNDWRKKRRETKINEINRKGCDISFWLNSLNAVERPLAEKLTNAILENDGISDDTATTYIGCIKDMYGFESFKVFTKELDEMHILNNESAIKLLTDWNSIETKEYAKIAVGRIKTIEQFDKYITNNASESKVIQKFLEEFPWLLDPKMSKFEREVTYSKILKQNFNDSYLPESNRRIDFLCTANSGIVHVIELKRPNIKLTVKEIQQIAEYVEFIENHYPQATTRVIGYLISDNMSYEPGSQTIRDSLEITGKIFIKSYSDLLAEARSYNMDLYKMYELIEEKK